MRAKLCLVRFRGMGFFKDSGKNSSTDLIEADIRWDWVREGVRGKEIESGYLDNSLSKAGFGEMEMEN